jgi:lysophospholipase L1-like esterase
MLQIFLLCGLMMLLSTKPTNLTELRKTMKSGKEVKIICYGDSITYGFEDVKTAPYHPYPQTLEELLIKKYKNANISVINEGHSGWRSDQAGNKATELVLNQKPDVVLLDFGINDAYSDFTEVYFKKKMIELVKSVKKDGALVVILSPTPINTNKSNMVKAYIPVLEAIAKEQKVLYFDLHNAILKRTIKEKKKLSDILPDNIHFSNEYYPWLAEEIFKFLNNAS